MKLRIGERIRKVRDLKGFSQQALAEAIEISQKQLSRIETEQISPTFELVEKICAILSVPMKSLLEFNEDIIFNSYTTNQQGGEFFAYNNTDIKQVESLYKQLLSEKDKIISLLEEKVKEGKK